MADPGNGEGATASSTNGSGGKGTAARPTKALPTDRLSFDRQLAVLRAYGAVAGNGDAPASTSQIASVVNLNASTVSVCNPFFSECGLIERADGGYRAASDTVAFQKAAEWDVSSAPEKLAPTLRETWFARILIPRLGVRPLEEVEAVRILAETCGASPAYGPQVKLLLDYLDAAKIIARNGTLIQKGQHAGGEPPRAEPRVEPHLQAKHSDEPGTRRAESSGPVNGVGFDVSVHVSMAEIASWTPDRISAFFAGIAQVLAAKGAGGGTST